MLKSVGDLSSVRYSIDVLSEERPLRGKGVDSVWPRIMQFSHNIVDASLDLNMMIIQVRPIISEWFNFGAAIGIPQEILVELNAMTLGDFDKLVEMVDYWFKSFPKDAPPTWRDVAKGLNIIGKNRMASELMKVYESGI